MRILLVNPYNVGWIGLQNILQLEPLGLEIIGAVLKDQHDVYIQDLRFEPHFEKKIRRRRAHHAGAVRRH